MNLINEKLDKFITENCEGCVNSWGNQLGHTCLTENKYIYFEHAVQYLYEIAMITEFEYNILLALNSEY